MKSPRWLFAILFGTVLALVPSTVSMASPSTVTAQAAADAGDSVSGAPRTSTPPPPQSLCDPGAPPNAPQTTAFYNNNALFGPLNLPTASPVGPLLAGYQRFGAQSESEWLKNYTVPATSTTPVRLFFPPQNGYVLGPDGKAAKTRQTLLPGYRLDRFGFTGGTFLSPIGTAFNARSLPPQNLSTPPFPPDTAPAPLANYHTYCILKPFSVDSGSIAPWFAQPGGGTQFELNQAYFPQATTTVTVQWLIDHKFITEEYLDGTCVDQDGWAAPSGACS
ncbi:hypothetical protein GCM10023322_33410 [Rugosimonospora acidiphila]|uniref:TNT domain-containing protein n=1 Tax=Rugosimonospora acidiphila TaxID=556531 RepID=A0ABP9RT53_9ACTN